MRSRQFTPRKILLYLILISTVVRVCMAVLLELSVDEVYYWLYALYPDWSHFDHPPMVGLTIQLFSLDLLMDGEFYLRLGPIIYSIINTLVLFQIGRELKDERTGLYIAFLYTSSIYLSVLSGTFIIPDAPQMLFWIASLYFLLRSLSSSTISSKARIELIIAGIFIGLATLSKYHGIFIGLGMVLYVLFHDRRWLKEPAFYIAGIVALLLLTPILYWNIQHEFASFGFHSNRVNPQFRIRLDYFLTEIIGQFGYNNPVNYILIISALIALITKKLSVNSSKLLILLYNGLPLWLVFTSFSLFRSTLPHWTGPAFTPLLVIAALYLRDKQSDDKALFPKSLKTGNYLILILAFVALFIINYLPMSLGKNDSLSDYGDGDFTQDMYGWDQVAAGFLKTRNEDIRISNMPEDAPILVFRYFPAAHFDYYFANKNNINVYVSGDISRSHNYYWINQRRGQIDKGQDAYTIVVSNWYSNPKKDYGLYFERIEEPEIIAIKKSGVIVRYVLIYRLRGYKGNHPNLEYGNN